MLDLTQLNNITPSKLIFSYPNLTFIYNLTKLWLQILLMTSCYLNVCKYCLVWKTSCDYALCLLWQVFLFHAIVRLSETNIAPPPCLLVPSHPEMHKFGKGRIVVWQFMKYKQVRKFTFGSVPCSTFYNASAIGPDGWSRFILNGSMCVEVVSWMLQNHLKRTWMAWTILKNPKHPYHSPEPSQWPCFNP